MQFKSIRQISLFLIFVSSCFGEWPQWRGAKRDGVYTGRFDASLISQSSLDWESGTIPSGDEGGFGSLVSDGSQVYLSLVWHRDVPTNTRTMTDLFLRKFGARKMNLPKEITERAEMDRLSLNPRLRGSKLEAWIDQWIENHLDQRQKMVQGDLIAARFKQGKLALPIEVIEKLHSVKNQTFPSQNALDKWLSEQGFEDELVNRISESVPPTKRVADDVVLALDIETGKQKWKASIEGRASGRSSSSTPCIDEDRIFAVGSNRVFCVDKESGKVIWDRTLDVESIASSPIHIKDRLVALVGKLTAFDPENGEVIWENSEIQGKAGSPIAFTLEGKEVIACNGSKKVFMVDGSTGETIWSGPGGGSSTPVFGEDYLLVHSKDKDVGLIAYDLSQDPVQEVWRFPKLTRRSDSSPIIYNKHAYLIGAGMRACFDLATGRLIRKVPANHDISSPVLVAGTILAYEIKGNFLSLIDTNPENFDEINRFKINALRCTSPAIVGDKILIRKEKSIGCVSLK